jgi:5-methyltetrahydrofolate--homocysteine methyltransferase
MTDNLITLLVELKEQDCLRVTGERLEAGEDPHKIIEDAREAMEIVGQRFADNVYFIPDLVYSGKILEQISEIVKPELSQKSQTKRLGKFVIGSVAGDLHDIGKNLVSFMLDVSGFEVFDLGVDVPAQAFVDKIKEVEAEVLGLSGFLTSVYQAMKDTVEAVKTAGLRDQVKIMIGGGVMDDEVKKFSGADAYRPDAMAAVTLAKEWIGGA